IMGTWWTSSRFTSAATAGPPSTSPIRRSLPVWHYWPWNSSARTSMTLQAGPEDQGLGLDVFFARHLSQFTRSHIQTLNRSGAVRIDGRCEKAGYKLKGTEAIEINLATIS